MHITGIEQDTDEWLDWRSGGITATDISTICGVNPYSTAEELFLVKTGQANSSFEGNDNITRGKALEPYVRDLVNNHYQVDFQPACVEHRPKRVLRASLDGLTDSAVLEIKCTSHFGTQKRNSGKVEFFDEKKSAWQIIYAMPEYYLYQQQFQMLVTGLPLCIFATYLDTDLKILQIAEDKQLQKTLKKEALKFWKRIEDYRK